MTSGRSDTVCCEFPCVGLISSSFGGCDNVGVLISCWRVCHVMLVSTAVLSLTSMRNSFWNLIRSDQARWDSLLLIRVVELFVDYSRGVMLSSEVQFCGGFFAGNITGQSCDCCCVLCVCWCMYHMELACGFFLPCLVGWRITCQEMIVSISKGVGLDDTIFHFL